MPLDALFKMLKHKKEYNEEPLKVGDTLLGEILRTGDDYPEGSYYLQSGEPFGGETKFLGKCSKEVKKKLEKIAENEYNLLRLIMSSDINVFCLVGPPGSGKSTTLNYIYKEFIISKGRYHCGRKGCNKNRIAIKIDFNASDWRKYNNVEIAREYLISEILKRLQTQLYSTNIESEIMTHAEDLKDFWDWIIQQIDNNIINNDMSTIVEINSLIANTRDKRFDVNFRKECRKKIFSDKEKKLDYLFCLSQYMNNIKYSKKKICMSLIFDNIDYAHVFIQEELLRLVVSRMLPYNFKVCIVLRWETLERHKLFHKLIEYREHIGPSARDLLLFRTKEFKKKFDSAGKLLETYEFKNEKQALEMLKHIDKITTILEKDQNSSLNIFLETAMKEYLRSMIKSAQHLFYNRKDFITRTDKSDHHLLRVMLRNKLDFFKPEDRSPVCNLFYCRDEHKNFPLLKLRILYYINSIPEIDENKFGYLVQIYKFLKIFKYTDTAIRDAFNDLLAPSHQVLFSNNKDYIFKTSDLHDVDNEDKIFISAIGRRYLDYVVYTLDYIGEMIACCAFDDKYLNNIKNSSFATERIHASLRFLKNCMEIETSQVKDFLMHEGISADYYYNIFGNNMITFTILIKIFDQILRIRKKVIESKPELEMDFYGILSDYKSILLKADYENEEIAKKYSFPPRFSKEVDIVIILKEVEKYIQLTDSRANS